MKETMDVRIGRYLSGEMAGHEREGFEDLMTQDSRLKSQVESAARIWQLASIPDAGAWDTAAAWEKITSADQPAGNTRSKPVRRLLYWAVAASAIFLAGMYGLFFKSGPPVVYAYKEGVNEPVQLKDGTKVYLNKDAEIIVYPFSSAKRHVELKGEAFFEVTSDPDRPFTVSAGETMTEVVGTSFNIRQSVEKTLIFVNSGKIIFSSGTDSKVAVALTAGEAAVFKEGAMELIANPSPNINAWRTQYLRFVKMPLSSVVEDVSAYFDQEIIIENESSKACIINIPLAFKRPDISAVLQAVAVSISAELVQEGNAYIIRGGKSCS